MKKLLFCFLAYVSFLSVNVFGQTAGEIDLSFNPDDAGYGIGDGATSDIWALCLQPDGKIIASGNFTAFNHFNSASIVRLNPDGSIDSSFHIGSGANAAIIEVVLQSDNKILIGGHFTSFNGYACGRIARLNVDGSLDTSFHIGTGADDVVGSIALQSDGKILIAGGFQTFNGQEAIQMLRLNQDGSIDSSFSSGTGTDGYILSVAVQSDNRAIVGGDFSHFNGVFRNRILRLNIDGSVDSSFVPLAEADSWIYHLKIQDDGKIILCGEFNNVSGVARQKIARLNADGSLDSSFNPGVVSGIYINSCDIQSDGKIVIGGNFTAVGGLDRLYVARLNIDGSIDSSFYSGDSSNNYVTSILVLGNQEILAGGLFTLFGGLVKNRLVCLFSDGSVDDDFCKQSGANGIIRNVVIQNDQKIIIVGNFSSFNGTVCNNLARLNTDGTYDTSFNIGVGANSDVWTALSRNDGKVLVGGSFTSFNGLSRKYLVRLNSDGSLDNSFYTGPGINGSVLTMASQSDGKLLIGGTFTYFSSTSCNRILRLDSNGVLDATFNVGSGADGSVLCIRLQSDGKVIIGGEFTHYNGISRNRIARLNADGSLDTSFNPGIGTDYPVTDFEIQSDGKIVIAGRFKFINGTSRNRIARLNADGSLDITFDPGSGANSYINSVSIQCDAKMLIGGSFTEFNGVSANRIARLNTDGTLDPSFVSGSGANDYIFKTAIQADGAILIAGLFTSYNGTGRNRVARIHSGVSVNVFMDNETQKYRVYPNPFIDNIYFDGFNSNISHIIINNLSGQTVYSIEIKEGGNISLGHLVPGVYLLTVINENGDKQVIKIIKE